MVGNAAAVVYKTIYNAQTGRIDYVVNIASTSIGDLVDVSTTGASGGNCLVYNGTDWVPGSCGGGAGGTAIWFQDGGVDVVQASTVNFTGAQFIITNSAGKALVALDASSVTLQGQNGVILNQGSVQSAQFNPSSGSVTGPFNFVQSNQSGFNPIVVRSTFQANAAVVGQAGWIVHAQVPATTADSFMLFSIATMSYQQSNFGQYGTVWYLDQNEMLVTIAGVTVFSADGTQAIYGVPVSVPNLNVSSFGTGIVKSDGSGDLSSSALLGEDITFQISPTTGIAPGTLPTNVPASSITVSGVTPGSYTTANITVGVDGRLTAASNGTGGSGGSSSLAVATGTSSGFVGTISSPTAVINFSSSTFKGTFTGSATSFMELLPSSVTLNGQLFAGSGITLTPGSGGTTIAATGGGSGDMILASTQTNTGRKRFANVSLALSTGDAIADMSGNEYITFQPYAQAINQFEIWNSTTGVNPILVATSTTGGGDTNVGMTLQMKGTGGLVLTSTSTATPSLVNSGAIFNNAKGGAVADSVIVKSSSSPTFLFEASPSTNAVIMGGRFVLPSKTLSQFLTTAPTTVGELYYCSDCTTDGIVVSTGTAAGGFARCSARTTPPS